MERIYWEKAQHLFEQAARLDWLEALPAPVRDELPKVALGSDFVIRQMLVDPAGVEALLACDALFSPCPQCHGLESFSDFLSQQIDPLTDASFDHALRQYRNRAYVALIWRDLLGRDDLWQTMTTLSQLADSLIMSAYRYHRAHLVARHGEPLSPSGQVQHLVILAMGKLGACELNLSSDVDLIFCYPFSGETRADDPTKTSISNQEFFVKLGQRLIKSLSRQTQEGFVFRVDMRLRPFGQSGALALNFNALETYYQDHGRPWERYALIKARPLSEDAEAGAQIIARLTPFVFRRYVDFGAIDELREMKALINQEVLRRNQEHNIKLGSGGIREIEFIAQAFQLIRGGQQREFQQRELRQILALLAEMKLLPEVAVNELEAAYVFLRISEHRLQAVQDQQTHVLPQNEADRLRLACSMGYKTWSSYLEELDRHRANVRTHFDEMVRRPLQEEVGATQVPWVEHFSAWWHQSGTRLLPKDNHKVFSPEVEKSCIDVLADFRREVEKKRLSAQGQGRLDRLMPRLLACCFDQKQPDIVLFRVLPIVAKILRRSAYIVLLIERPDALSRLVQLCKTSSWLAEYLMKFPVLLDELLYLPEYPYAPGVGDLEHELREQLMRVNDADLETQMEILRQFKNAHVFYAAVAELQHSMGVDDVSRYLTAVAQVVVQAAFEIACMQVSDRFELARDALVSLARAHFLIVAMGKMGSFEMSYGSDLDLIFVHDCDSQASVSPACPIDNGTFLTRLTQRLIHILSTSTYTGRLYEIDARLRPFGGSGLLVSSIESLDKYLKNEAWTWEHQALVRARPVVGSPLLGEKFRILRDLILKRDRNPEQLKAEIMSMRQKMLTHLRPRQREGNFHLKHDSGGIVDIEFIVQYLVLRWAGDYADLTLFTEVTRLLLAAGRHRLLPDSQANALIEAYRDYRGRLHRLVLQNQEGVVPVVLIQAHVAAVQEAWSMLMLDE